MQEPVQVAGPVKFQEGDQNNNTNQQQINQQPFPAPSKPRNESLKPQTQNKLDVQQQKIQQLEKNINQEKAKYQTQNLQIYCNQRDLQGHTEEKETQWNGILRDPTKIPRFFLNQVSNLYQQYILSDPGKRYNKNLFKDTSAIAQDIRKALQEVINSLSTAPKKLQDISKSALTNEFTANGDNPISQLDQIGVMLKYWELVAGMLKGVAKVMDFVFGITQETLKWTFEELQSQLMNKEITAKDMTQIEHAENSIIKSEMLDQIQACLNDNNLSGAQDQILQWRKAFQDKPDMQEVINALEVYAQESSTVQTNEAQKDQISKLKKIMENQLKNTPSKEEIKKILKKIETKSQTKISEEESKMLMGVKQRVDKVVQSRVFQGNKIQEQRLSQGDIEVKNNKITALQQENAIIKAKITEMENKKLQLTEELKKMQQEEKAKQQEQGQQKQKQGNFTQQELKKGGNPPKAEQKGEELTFAEKEEKKGLLKDQTLEKQV